MYYAMRRRRHVAETNIRLCFPGLDRHAQRSLVREHFRSLGMMLMESALCWWGSDERMRALVSVDGTEHLHNALAAGRGVLMLSGHFTTNELAGRFVALTLPWPVHSMYRPHENPFIDHLIYRGRARSLPEQFARDDIRGLLRALKQNKIVWYAPDQAYVGKGSVIAPFFGVPAATNPATARIAKMSGAAVVPFFPRRLPGGAGYEIRILPALTGFPSGDEVADAERVNQVFEDLIRQAPEQYYWIHRRFKHRYRPELDAYSSELDSSSR